VRDRLIRHRQIAEPVVLEEEADSDMEIDNDDDQGVKGAEVVIKDEAVELDEEERMHRRMELKKKALERQEELLKVEEEKSRQAAAAASDESESDDESEYEECTDSDEDVAAPRLKPVFVRK
jgi:microfibrillar-associated protein 1